MKNALVRTVVFASLCFGFTVFVLLIMPAALQAQSTVETVQPGTVNGNPAILITGQLAGPVRTTIVERGGSAEEPSLIFHLVHLTGSNKGCSGLFTITAQKLHWQAECEKEPLDLTPADVILTDAKNPGEILFPLGKRKYDFQSATATPGEVTYSWLVLRLFEQALSDFPAALTSFEKMRNEKAHPRS